jgi:hypothetical protein
LDLDAAGIHPRDPRGLLLADVQRVQHDGLALAQDQSRPQVDASRHGCG